MIAPRVISLAALIVFMPLVAGCSKNSESPGDPQVGIIVARTEKSESADATLHVKTNTSDECGIVYRVNASTKLQAEAPRETVVPAAFADFKIGSHVRVWAPFVAESCPGQATATEVQLALE